MLGLHAISEAPISDVIEAAATTDTARRGGYVEEWRVHKAKRSQREEAREIYQAVRDAFDGVKKVAPKKAPEIAPPAMKAKEPPLDWQAVDRLYQSVSAFAERQNKRAIKAAAEAYRKAVAQYRQALEAQLAQQAMAAFEAEQARLREEAIAADDEEIIAAWVQRRRAIAAAAVEIVQARQKRMETA